MSLIAHYKLDGNANDALGKYNGTASNVTWVDGKLGQCAYFSSTPTSAINLGNVFNIGAGELSVSLWFNPNSYSDTYLFSKTRAAGQVSRYALRLKTDGKLTVLVAPVDAAAHIDYDCNTNIKLNTWTHTCIVFSRNNPCRVYVNGIIDREFTPPYFKDTNFISNNPFKIGAYTASDNISNITSFDGLIDDVRIYDHALSEREVRDLSQGLVLHYTFDQFQEPTENKVTSHIPVWGAWDGFTGTSVTFSEGNISGIKLTGTASGGVKWRESNYIQALPSTTYTVSAIMKWLGTYPSPNFFYLRQYNSAGAQVEERGVFLATGLSRGQWRPVSETFTTRSDCASFIIEGYQYIAPCEIWCGNLQVEQKSYATPFVNGTRAGIVRDQSTQGNDAPLALANTPKWVEGGMVGKGCYEFAGYGKTPGILSPQIKTDKYTISFWAKHTSADKMAFGSGRSEAFYWYGDYSWKYRHGGTSGEFYYPKSQMINIGEWGHFAVTYDGSNVRIYRNGVYEGLKASSGIPNFDRHSIGYGYANTSYDFQGQIDDVRIYATALTTEEIRELYQQRASLDSQGNFYSSLISSNVGYQKVWGDGSGVGFTIYGIDGSSVSTNGVLRFTTINIDPKINMYNIGSFDPNVYKYIQVKYRVVSGNAGDVEIFFTNTQYTAANAAQHRGAPLNSDGNWNVVTVTMHTHANWTNSNITGWRFDMGTASGVTIEVEWIRLVSDTGALSVKSNKVVGNFSEVGITNGLVAYYPLNKDAKDYSGNGYHGTVTGAVLTGGGFDGKGAYRFDGVDDKITSTQTVPFNLTVFTVSFWISTTTTNNTVVMERGANNGWSIQTMPSPLGVGKIGMVSGGTSSVARSLNTINDGAWHYVAIVNNNAVATVYVDGEDVTLDNVTGAPSYNSVPFIIGQRETDTGVFNGGISNVKIFNRALTPEEIAVEYKRTGVSKMTQHNGTVYIQGQVKETI